MLHLRSAARMLLPIRFIPFVTVVQLFAVAATQTVAWPAALAVRIELKRYSERNY
jgi:hypothetical protein